MPKYLQRILEEHYCLDYWEIFMNNINFNNLEKKKCSCPFTILIIKSLTQKKKKNWLERDRYIVLVPGSNKTADSLKKLQKEKFTVFHFF